VRQVVRGGRADVFRSRTNSLDPFTKQLETAWANGCRNGAALWRRVKAAGFVGSLRVVTEWATRRRRPELWSKLGDGGVREAAYRGG